MTWKRNLDDIKILCKDCDCEMILESTLNDTHGKFICKWCGGHANIIIEGGEGRGDDKI